MLFDFSIYHLHAETEMSWSMIGMCAEMVKQPKPTMMLNLSSMEETVQRSQVIHEFGHALGLAHEHQRVDFWDKVEPHINMERMMDDSRVKDPISDFGKQTIGADWRATKHGVTLTLRKIFGKLPNLKTEEFEYDPDSIMHYG